MRKIVAISCLLILLALFTPKDSLALEDFRENKEINSTDIIDFSAPTILLNISSYNATGEIFGSIIEDDSNIYNHQILLNGSTIPSLIYTTNTLNLIEFQINANTAFNQITGYHNYLYIEATNDGVAPTPNPTINQPGGAGGGGGFMFCDDIHCWGPVPLQPNHFNNLNDYELHTIVTDTTAPTAFFDLTSFPCCGNVIYLNHTDYESGVNNTDVDIYPEMKSYFANNTEGIEQWINITWSAEEDIPTPTLESSYFAFSSFFFIAIIALYVKRKKFKH